MLRARDVIRLLNLQPHPIEGGHFRETHRSALTLPGDALPAHRADRAAGTAIYYLLIEGAVSEMHRLPGEEVFHFYLGDPLETLLLHPDGRGEVRVLGPDLADGQRPQSTIPGDVWQGSTPLPGPHGYTLIGATMAPAFDYVDYRRGMREPLKAKWPAFAERIALLTPNG